MARRGKQYRAKLESLKSVEALGLDDACQKVIEGAYAKFDESVDAAIRLGVNPRHADQMVRGTVVLPHGIGKDVRVCVFATGEKEKEAQDAGADIFGGDELIERVKGGFLDFDKAIATPDIMGKVGKLGKILGPRGLMPNPKVGTVTFDVAKAIQELKSGKIEFRVEKAGILHVPIGRVSFGREKLKENIIALLETVNRLKPASSKGAYFKGISLSSTMGIGIRVATYEIRSVL